MKSKLPLDQWNTVIGELLKRGWSRSQLGRRLRMDRRSLQGRQSPPLSLVCRRAEDLLEEPAPKNRLELMLGLMRARSEDGVYDGGIKVLAQASGYKMRQTGNIMRELADYRLITKLDSEPGWAATSRWRINVDMGE